MITLIEVLGPILAYFTAMPVIARHMWVKQRTGILRGNTPGIDGHWHGSDCWRSHHKRNLAAGCTCNYYIYNRTHRNVQHTYDCSLVRLERQKHETCDCIAKLWYDENGFVRPAVAAIFSPLVAILAVGYLVAYVPVSFGCRSVYTGIHAFIHPDVKIPDQKHIAELEKSVMELE